MNRRSRHGRQCRSTWKRSTACALQSTPPASPSRITARARTPTAVGRRTSRSSVAKPIVSPHIASSAVLQPFSESTVKRLRCRRRCRTQYTGPDSLRKTTSVARLPRHRLASMTGRAYSVSMHGSPIRHPMSRHPPLWDTTSKVY